MGRKKYQSHWSSNYNWVKPSKKSENYAYCCICCTDINLSAGVTQLQVHEKTKKKHKDSVEGSSKQSKFIVKDGDVFLVNKDGKRKTLSTEDMTAKAEIYCCLDIIDSNCSFWAADAGNEKYRKIFQNSVIANSYKQKSDKVK